MLTTTKYFYHNFIVEGTEDSNINWFSQIYGTEDYWKSLGPRIKPRSVCTLGCLSSLGLWLIPGDVLQLGFSSIRGVMSASGQHCSPQPSYDKLNNSGS